MADPFVGEIRMFAGNFAPSGWAYCDGQLLAISQNDVLFSLLGTTYGGDGRRTFGLPDLRGRVPLHQGTGPGLSPRKLGSRGGAEQMTLTTAQLASHTHDMNGNTAKATGAAPAGNVVASSSPVRLYSETNQTGDLASSSIAASGGGRAHTNLMPTQCVHFIVALVGVYPSRN